MSGTVRAAAIRRRIRIPLRFGADYSTMATVVSFTGLTDAQQHVALELGRPAAARLPLVRIGLLSNNPDNGAQLGRLGITIARQVPTGLHLTGANAAYLVTKAQRGGHDLLARSLERAAEPHRHAGPLDPAHLGTEGR